MICPHCGASIPDESVTCPYCDRSITDSLSEITPEAKEKVDRKEFFKSVCSAPVRNGIKAAVIILYICAGISLFAQAAGGVLPLDAIVILALALWIRSSKSKASAIVTLVYAVINTVFILISAGTFGGWLILIAAILAIVFVIKGEKEWQAYLAE